MANLRVLVPDSTTNYVKNPSFRHNTDGWDIIATPWDVLYYLYDQFNTDVAAGSVNATNAEPVGGPRTVTDTYSKISIAGGVLVWGGGEVASTDHLHYPQQTRVLGITLLADITPTIGSGAIGWDTNNSGLVVDGVRFASSLQVVSSTAVGVYTALPYKIAIVLRTSIGAFYFIKGGLFTAWTLLYVSNLGGSGSSYPGVDNSWTEFAASIDNIRVPKRLFIPIPLCFDDFD